MSTVVAQPITEKPRQDQAAQLGGPGNVVVVEHALGCSGIVNRVTSIPMVSSTIGQVTNMYTWTKENSSIANAALGYAEKSVVVAVSTAKPVVDHFQKPITMASDFACHQLDKLEDKVPLITKPTDEVISTIQEGTWQMIEDTKQRGTDGLNKLMNTRVGQAVSVGLDTALTVSEYAVDYCLPPEKTDEQPVSDGENTEKEDIQVEKAPVTVSSVERVSLLTSKVRRRIHQRALKNIRYAQKRSQETIEKLRFTVNLIDYAKGSVDGASQAIRTSASDAHAKLWDAWSEWIVTDKGADTQAEQQIVNGKSGEQKTVAIALHLARRLHGITENLASSVSNLPEQIRAKVDESRALALSVYTSFQEAHYLSDISTGVLDRCRDQMDKLASVTSQVADFVVNAPPLHWLMPVEVPSMDMDGTEFDYILGSDQNDVDLESDSGEF